MRIVALLVAASLASVAAFADAPPALRPDDLAKRFVESWNAHAFAEFGPYLASDTDWTTASGLVLRGRPAVVAYLGDEHATWARTTSMTATRVVIRELSQSTAVVRLEWQISSPAAEDSPAAFPGVTQFVAARTSAGWRVVVGQVTRGRNRAAR